MTGSPRLELISFKLCPFVQRAAIVLLEKGCDFDVTYIDLKNKPDWFLEISPMGKVPVLKVDDEVLFESAVIAEYLDETHPPQLHPENPLQRARNRAWIEFSSEMLMDHFRMLNAAGKDDFDSRRNQLADRLGTLERTLGDGPFFNGRNF
ncbi:MAG: glutathione S-transferase family protein, partial [Desulfuromonadales bacterium]|nr:glutathione S-transferase family protein [Desulfuromonadales bacterium]NIR33501.1 glutathione S-transferase family protein [Desulfuromonadales bacterium]NIS43532.1 glutathione S-transferase family protein [Desulfuromonadales bacterium]